MTKISTAPTDTRASIARGSVTGMALAVFAIVVLLPLPLALNPGYFSHDELQWAAIAAQGGAFDWSERALWLITASRRTGN